MRLPFRFSRLLTALMSFARDVADHFDTAHFVSKLEQEGLTRIQAEGIIGTLEEVIEQSIDNMQRNLVTRAEQDKVRSFLADFEIVVDPFLIV